jgi:hypothetical protein
VQNNYDMKLKIPPRSTYRLPHFSRYLATTPLTISNPSRFCSAKANTISTINKGDRNDYLYRHPWPWILSSQCRRGRHNRAVGYIAFYCCTLESSVPDIRNSNNAFRRHSFAGCELHMQVHRRLTNFRNIVLYVDGFGIQLGPQQ